jgi:hypothetical protein
VPDADLSFLPAEFRSSAIRTETGEVMWPLAVAAAVVNAIADAGRLILGLDLRSDGWGEYPDRLGDRSSMECLPP